jgi:hypothetical protein
MLPAILTKNKKMDKREGNGKGRRCRVKGKRRGIKHLLTEPFLRSCQLFSYSGTSRDFKEHEG